MRLLCQAALRLFVCVVLYGNMTIVPDARAEPPKCLASAFRRLNEQLGDSSGPLTPQKILTTIKRSIQNGLTPKTIVTKAGKFIFYPTIAPFRILQITMNAIDDYGSKGLIRVPFTYLKEDGTTIVGFVLFTQTVGATPIQAAEFYLLPKNKNGKFEEDTRVEPRTDGITVYVDAVSDDNNLAGYGENDFKQRFSLRSDTYYLHPRGISDMMNQLEKLTARVGKPIAELEILGHGFPGEIRIGEETLDSNNTNLTQGRKTPFVKDATIRFQSCLLGANYIGPDSKTGENFMRAFGKSILNNGGTVIASNHTIYVTTNFPPNARKNKGSWFAPYKSFIQPLEATIVFATEALKANDGPYRQVKIPAP